MGKALLPSAIALGGMSGGAVVRVPADYSTIQAGNEVVVAPGTCAEAIDFLGKAITGGGVFTDARGEFTACGVPDFLFLLARWV